MADLDSHDWAPSNLHLDAVSDGSEPGDRKSYTGAENEIELEGVSKAAAANDQAGPDLISEECSVILVMGVTGTGKSSFISRLTGQDAEIGHNLQSCTSRLESYAFTTQTRTTILVDTPAFDGTPQSETHMLVEIARFLCLTYSKGIRIAGIIYLHRITDNRLGGTAVRSLHALEALCGKGFMSNVVLVTSQRELMSSSRDQETAQVREKQLQKKLSENGLGMGDANLYRHDNTKKSALRIVNYIQSLNGNKTLSIQQEMMQDQIKLNETQAGLTEPEASGGFTERLLNGNGSKRCRNDRIYKMAQNQISKEIAVIEDERKGLFLDVKRFQNESEELHEDENDKFNLRWQNMVESFGQKEPTSFKSFNRNVTSTRGTQTRAKTSKWRLPLMAAVAAGLVPSVIVAMTVMLILSAAERGRERIRKLPKRIEGSEELLVVVSDDERKKHRPQEAHTTAPNGSGTCSEELGPNGAPSNVPFPEDGSEPGHELGLCSGLLRTYDITRDTDVEPIRNLSDNSEGRSSMTISSFSGDDTDWGGESDLEVELDRFHLNDSGHLPAERQEVVIQETLDPIKKGMLDRLMEDFWAIFDRNWPAGTRMCVATPGNNYPPTSTDVYGSLKTSVGGSGKHPTASDGSGNGEEFPNGGPGEGNGDPSNCPIPAPNATQSAGFACPYRKHNPRKYSVKNCRSCALSPLKTVARVKGHLYRSHIIHQCQRCKCLFKSEEELDQHIETSQDCDAILAPPIDGITRKMRAVLQCKRKAFPGQTEAERWRDIYQVLFPEAEEIPDPYFKPVRDNEESGSYSPHLADLSSYEQFLRTSLPRLVRGTLETEINNDIQPLEERLRAELPDIIEHALTRAFLEYRMVSNINHNVEPSIDSGYFSIHSRSASSQDRKGKGPAIDPGVEFSMQNPEAFLSPLLDTAPNSNSETSVLINQNSENMSAPEHLPLREDISDKFGFSEELLGDPSFLDKVGNPTSASMDIEYFDWELPLGEDIPSL